MFHHHSGDDSEESKLLRHHHICSESASRPLLSGLRLIASGAFGGMWVNPQRLAVTNPHSTFARFHHVWDASLVVPADVPTAVASSGLWDSLQIACPVNVDRPLGSVPLSTCTHGHCLFYLYESTRAVASQFGVVNHQYAANIQVCFLLATVARPAHALPQGTQHPLHQLPTPSLTLPATSVSIWSHLGGKGWWVDPTRLASWRGELPCCCPPPAQTVHCPGHSSSPQNGRTATGWPQ